MYRVRVASLTGSGIIAASSRPDYSEIAVLSLIARDMPR